MNPFDLSGPLFLLFYFGFSALVILALVFLRRTAESPSTPRIDLSDPYLIAYLRGGESEALRVATVSLIDRKLLVVTGREIKSAANASTASVHRPIEIELLRRFQQPGESKSIFEDYGLLATCKSYEQTLKTARLLPDESMERARMTRVGIASFVLFGVAIAKILIALDRGHGNVWFLVILMAVAIFFAVKFSFPRLTESGKSMLAGLQNLYSGMKERAPLQLGGAGIEPMMLAAVFGIGALEGADFAFTRVLFPRAANNLSSTSCSSACGSSCGSSCSGGGCGGGCGGCGG